jgi:hypothetical protein
VIEGFKFNNEEVDISVAHSKNGTSDELFKDNGFPPITILDRKRILVKMTFVIAFSVSAKLL